MTVSVSQAALQKCDLYSFQSVKFTQCLAGEFVFCIYYRAFCTRGKLRNMHSGQKLEPY